MYTVQELENKNIELILEYENAKMYHGDAFFNGMLNCLHEVGLDGDIAWWIADNYLYGKEKGTLHFTLGGHGSLFRGIYHDEKTDLIVDTTKVIEKYKKWVKGN